MNRDYSGLAWLALLLSTQLVVGCSADSSGTQQEGPGTGGNSGSGGGFGAGGVNPGTGGEAGGTTLGVGGAVAAVSLNILGGPGCSLTPGYDDVPVVPGGHPVTAAGATTTIADNTTTARGLVRVNCSITGGVFDATVSIHDGQAAIVFTVALSPPPDANLSYQMEASNKNYAGTIANMCTATAIAPTPTGGLYKVTCPDFVDVAGVEHCALGDSFVYFEGCGNGQ
jgi:hypothetical protein